jgi:small-conductance mechanosensitive channel
MQFDTILKTSLLSSWLIAFAGAFFKIMHLQGAEWILITAVATYVVFIACAIYEIQNAGTFSKSEKIMWTIALLFMSNIAGLIYVLTARKQISSNKNAVQ